MNNTIDKKNFYDVVVIGGGPAGLTAAIYLARAKYRVVVVEKEKFGGQITITHEVVNYPGVEKTSGEALTESMRMQAQNFGAEFMLTEVLGIDMNGDIKTVRTARGELKCFGVLLATGAHPRNVGFSGEEEYRGRGVAYCATCDGEFFTGKDVFVIGGGFAAAEESVFLTKFARKVTMIIRRDDFSCAESVAEQAKNHEKIDVIYNTVVEEVSGENGLDYIRYKNNVTGEITEFRAQNGETFGVFVFAGYVPATGLIKGIAELDESGYVITDRNQKTNIDGLYAAGDVCVKVLRQVVTAVGDGATAATELEKYASAMQSKTGLVPEFNVPESAPKKEEPAQVHQPSSGALFDEAMLAQLNTVFARMENPLVLRLFLDDKPVSSELRGYINELASVTDKLTVEVSTEAYSDTPCVKVYRKDGSCTGLAFHGVPGGHEFTSFVLGLYNASGTGQPIDPDAKAQIEAINTKVDIKILVSLSCTMCPDLVIAAQKIASMNDNITAEVYDINHFPELKDKYKVMSVPCFVINDDSVNFGKKNIPQLLELIAK
ncbi:MAG: FAD-dependent oxidoreductase [Anaerofustis stercorihominis]|nr:FAD-dependent oxidoreductase [Anaerofustis stercorihominis]